MAQSPTGIYVCVGTRDPVKLGFTWRMWWGRTSFYLKPRLSILGGLKVSLHGPDPRHTKPGYKIAADGAPPRDDQVYMESTDGFLPCWFGGQAVRAGADRVARLRWTSELFSDDFPPGPNAGRIGKGFQGSLLQAPPPGFAADVDLFLVNYAPYYGEKERDVFGKNAVIGPIKSAAGQYLTGIVFRRSLEEAPTPPDLLRASPPMSPADAVRGMAAGVYDERFVWICEVPMSRQAIQSGARSAI